MSNDAGSTGPGWYHAEGDPAGTQRYWNGSEWQGEPQVVPAPPAAPMPQAPPATPAAPTPIGFGPPPAAAPEKKSNALKWVFGILLFIVLGIGGCTFAVWRFASGPIDASNDYLNAIQAEDFDRAWSLSNPSCFPEGGPDQLASIFDGTEVTGYDLRSTSVENDSGEAAGRVTLNGGDERSIALTLTRVGDDWLVCGFDIGAPGS